MSGIQLELRSFILAGQLSKNMDNVTLNHSYKFTAFQTANGEQQTLPPGALA